MQCQKRTDTSFGCSLVGRRDLERRQAMHRDKLQRIGSSIDTRAPAPQPHLTLYGRDYVSKKRATTEAAFSDLKMIQSIARTMTRKPDIPERKGPVSLNADARKTEIYRIMKENHKLLDRLETLEPIVSTTELLRSHKDKQRYTILVSHSKRLAGEYDDDVERIKVEDKANTDSMKRSIQARITKYERTRVQNPCSMSMPSLTPMGSTDPPSVASTPAKKRGKPVVQKQLGGTGGLGSSSSSTRSAPAVSATRKVELSSETPAAKSVASPEDMDADARKSGTRVSFSGNDIGASEGKGSDWQPPAKTPYSQDAPAEMFFRDEDTPTAEEAPAAAPAQEFDSAAEQPSATVGVAGSPPEAAAESEGKAGESYEDYSQNFQDETLNQDSMSKALDGSVTLEDSKEG